MKVAHTLRPRRLIAALLGSAALLAAAPMARAQDTVFLSTQLRPIESAQRMRTQILAGAPVRAATATTPRSMTIDARNCTSRLPETRVAVNCASREFGIHPRRGGEIGRHARLRIWFRKE